MQMQTQFHQTKKMLTHILYDSGMEEQILKHWRSHEPKLVEELLFKGVLKKSLMQKAGDLFDLQIYLQRTEKLNPVLAKLEAWNQLMKPLTPEMEDQDEEEESSLSAMDY
jgi:hypothetical protein